MPRRSAISPWTLTDDDDRDDQVGMSADLLEKPIAKQAGFLIRIAARRNAEGRWAWPAGKPRIDAVAAFVLIVVIGKLDQPSPLLAGAPQDAADVPFDVAKEGCGDAANACQIGAMDRNE